MLGLSLAACGGGGGDTASSGTPTNPAAPVNPANPTDVGGTCDLPNFQQSLLDRINALRAAGADCGTAGVFPAARPLAWNASLALAADGHAQDMAAKNYFSHDSLDGRTFTDRINATNYQWSAIGENIAAGQTSVEAVVTSWRNSPGHCANLMSAGFADIGVACRPAASSANTYRTYWVMDIGRPR
ncbi:hypothetical protein CDN99_13415 [Roseateles aquatilis]|uniref:SCP domain-containing protein n=2 Tax=Roseateles aquatilis TaxID=431061 RepID=A0A246JD74_9BURK|nr:hypothetical protein CDN99_13415 [Roseateles aquatilis]